MTTEGNSNSNTPRQHNYPSLEGCNDVNVLHNRIKELENDNIKLRNQIEKLQNANVHLQLQVEEEEELITNKLIKKLNRLKREKEILAQQVEEEEELLTNTLQKKLEKVQIEKSTIENQLQKEKEYIINKLSKQLENVMQEKYELEKKIENERNEILLNIQQFLLDFQNKYRNTALTSPSKSPQALNAAVQFNDQVVVGGEEDHHISLLESKEMLEQVMLKLDVLKKEQERIVNENETIRSKNLQLRKEFSKLESENFLLEQMIKREKEKRIQMDIEQVRNEMEKEVNSERSFNELIKKKNIHKGSTSTATPGNTTSGSNSSSRSNSLPPNSRPPMLASLNLTNPTTEVSGLTLALNNMNNNNTTSTNNNNTSSIMNTTSSGTLGNNNMDSYNRGIPISSSPRLSPRLGSSPKIVSFGTSPQQQTSLFVKQMIPNNSFTTRRSSPTTTNTTSSIMNSEYLSSSLPNQSNLMNSSFAERMIGNKRK